MKVTEEIATQNRMLLLSRDPAQALLVKPDGKLTIQSSSSIVNGCYYLAGYRDDSTLLIEALRATAIALSPDPNDPRLTTMERIGLEGRASYPASTKDDIDKIKDVDTLIRTIKLL